MKFHLGDRVQVFPMGIGVALPRRGVVAATRDGRMTVVLDDGGEVNGPDDAPDCAYLGPAPDESVFKAFRAAHPILRATS